MSLILKSIGTVANEIGVSVHTLRYYEKIALLAPIAKDSGGRRLYEARDIERIRFIKRAQRMHFSLDEIRHLIEIDRAPSKAKPQARKLVQEKLSAIEESLKDLLQLREDLAEMLDECLQSGEGVDCPIIEGIKDGSAG